MEGPENSNKTLYGNFPGRCNFHGCTMQRPHRHEHAGCDVKRLHCHNSDGDVIDYEQCARRPELGPARNDTQPGSIEYQMQLLRNKEGTQAKAPKVAKIKDRRLSEELYHSSVYQPSYAAGGGTDLMRTLKPTPYGTFTYGGAGAHTSIITTAEDVGLRTPAADPGPGMQLSSDSPSYMDPGTDKIEDRHGTGFGGGSKIGTRHMAKPAHAQAQAQTMNWEFI